MIRVLAKLLRVLNSETEPSQISLGLCLALVAGLPPSLSLHNVVVLLLTLTLRVNLSAFLLGLAGFSGIAYFFDPLFHWVGLQILTASTFEGLWTTLYNSLLWRLERFYNSIVMGSLVVSLVLFFPLFRISNLLIRRYRQHLFAWVHRTKLMELFRATKLYQAYRSLSHLGGTS